jgi:3-dehydroquinate synthase
MFNKINLDLPEKSYEIIVGTNILEQLKIFLQNKNYNKIIAISDENVIKFHGEKLKNFDIKIDFVVVKSGESSKSFAVFEEVCEEILQKNIDRNTLLIAFGGGVVGDLTGFCASILLRGIDFIQIPTTLLAMVDSSVGGKTAINSRGGKNLIGSFYQPKLVLCDINFLETLSIRQFRAGYAEIVKYGFIYDKNFFEFLDENLTEIFNKNLQILQKIITRSCEIKSQIVGRDEKENGERALLNFGHTFGHIFETETNYSNEILHGEAVAIGMIMASQMSLNLGLLNADEYQKISNHLQKSGFELNLKNIRQNWFQENLIKHLFKDKKTENNQLTFILLNKIGEAKIHKKISLEIFLKVLKKFLD